MRGFHRDTGRSSEAAEVSKSEMEVSRKPGLLSGLVGWRTGGPIPGKERFLHKSRKVAAPYRQTTKGPFTDDVRTGRGSPKTDLVGRLRGFYSTNQSLNADTGRG